MMAKPKPVELLALYGPSPMYGAMLPLCAAPDIKTYGTVPLSIFFSMETSAERAKEILETGRKATDNKYGAHPAAALRLCRVKVSVLEVLK